MSFGLGWKAWQLSRHKNQQQCPRCSLRYERTLAKCPHCGELDSQGLAELKARIELDHRANTRLGKSFIFLAVLIVIALVLLNSQA
ncbi:MAG: hypothetical protein OEY52_16255 [Gammaproteobacteria bacterium]|nr:hypothetical protein [Gammaproteobacteria bacterium]